VPHRPAFSPVVTNSNFEFVEKDDAIIY